MNASQSDPVSRPDLGAFRLRHRLRVRWAEIDMQKIVFNAHYLMWADTAMAAYWRAMALPYESTLQALGGDLYVRRATVDYWASARYDDVVEVGVRCVRVGRSSMEFQAGVFCDGRPLVGLTLIYVFADPVRQTPLAVPDALRAVLTDFEDGREMLDVRLGTWNECQPSSMALRRTVFHDEQGIALELMSDEHDASAVHAIAFNRMGVAVGTARLLPPRRASAVPADGRHPSAMGTLAAGDGSVLGRMAVVRPLRGSGVGSAVLKSLIAAARNRGDTGIELHAQASAVAFYAAHGFRPLGPVFSEVGLPHQTLRLDL